MVKNKKGGKGHKKMARKHVNESAQSSKTRFPKNDEEIFARVTKVCGSGNFDVLCNDGITRMCIIRKRFKNRNKRDNWVELHGFLLVGLRNWQVLDKKKKEKVDLLYVYSKSDINDIQDREEFNNKLYQLEDVGVEFDEDGFDFNENGETGKAKSTDAVMAATEKEDENIDLNDLINSI